MKLVGSLFLTLTILLSAQSVNVPLSHWIYDLLERWETGGLIEQVYDHTKPYTRAEVAEYLVPVFQKFESEPSRFSSYDRQYLRYCSSEFAEELEALKPTGYRREEVNRFQALSKAAPLSSLWPRFLYRNNRDFVDASHGDFRIFAEPILQFSRSKTLTTDGDILRSDRLSNGLTFRGSLGNRIGFFFMLTDNLIKPDRPFPVLEIFEESGWPWLTNRTGKSVNFDENAAYLTYTDKYFSILVGRDYNQWGAGHLGQMMLSTNAPIYDQFKLTVRYWRFKYTHITAFVNYIAPNARRSVKSVPATDVYWAGNRLEVYLGKGVQIGLAESIVYGDQSLKLGYLNPLSFYKSLEHFYGDRDNGALSIDLAWRVLPGFKLFGEWFIDDLTTSKLGTKWFGNKFGYQAGFFWVDPLRLSATDLLVEYTRIRPYVYTHSVSDFNKYKHNDTVLGHYIGPNSDDLAVRLRYFPHRRLKLQWDLEAYRHGSNLPDRNVGGDPDLAFVFGQDNPNVTFLDGRRFDRTAIGGVVQYEFLRNTFVVLQLHRINPNNVGSRTEFSFRVSYNFGDRNEVLRPFETARE